MNSLKIFEAIVNFRETFDYKLINDFYDDNMYLPDLIMAEFSKEKQLMY